jgi:small subunit ribosomal protein S5
LLKPPAKTDWSFKHMQPRGNNPRTPVNKEFSEKIVRISRVSKKTKGGNQASFSVLVVVGDKKGKVGVAIGKAPDVLSSIKKAVRKAKKGLITIPMRKTTIPFVVESKHGAAKIILKPAPAGSGIIAGGAIRAVVEAAGVADIVGKSLGSNNKANNVYATFKALKEIERLVSLKKIELKKATV